MKRPTYADAQNAALSPPAGAEEGANAALFFQRIGPKCVAEGNGGIQFKMGGKHGTDAVYKAEWIASLQEVSSDRRAGCQALLTRAAERLKQVSESRAGTKDFCFEAGTQSRLMIGMGTAHPVGNGLTWHPVLGAPYLPGSGIKGMVQAYAHEFAEPESVPEDRQRIFGQDRDHRIGGETPAEGATNRGSVIFLDALPLEPVGIVTDIMTPHWGGWYRGTGLPDETASPNPIRFPAVSAGVRFQFALAPATMEPQAIEDCRQAKKWLIAALKEIGAGARTRANYGRFESIDQI